MALVPCGGGGVAIAGPGLAHAAVWAPELVRVDAQRLQCGALLGGPAAFLMRWLTVPPGMAGERFL